MSYAPTPTPPRTITITDPANIVVGNSPQQTGFDPQPEWPPPYFTFNLGETFTEAPNFAPVEIEPAEEGDDISPVIIDPVE